MCGPPACHVPAPASQPLGIVLIASTLRPTFHGADLCAFGAAANRISGAVRLRRVVVGGAHSDDDAVSQLTALIRFAARRMRTGPHRGKVAA